MYNNETGEEVPTTPQNALVIPLIVLAIILLLLVPINMAVIYYKIFRRRHTYFAKRNASRSLHVDGIYRTSDSSHESNQSAGLLELRVIEPAGQSNTECLDSKQSPLKRKDLSDPTEHSTMDSRFSKIGRVDTDKVEVVNNYWGYKREKQCRHVEPEKANPRTRAKSFPPPRCSTGRRVKHPPKLPVFNLAGDQLTDSLSPVSGVQYFDDIPSSLDQRCTPPFATTLTTIEQTTSSPSCLLVPMNTPVKSISSSTPSCNNTQTTDIDFGASAGVTKHIVSSDSNMNITIHTETDSSFVWDSFDPSYKSRHVDVSYANGAFVPVLRQTQFWV
ncbi:uncharacterized protein [Antedon mediterranea]|uniref:uncharacterized protein n=1 Tax=Antedon mediterranea TaxID=105859 RepID=UPI003AF9BC66